MAFNDHVTRDIIIDKEDNEYIYLKQPLGFRVSKTTFKFEKYINGVWVPSSYSWSGNRKIGSTYPAISWNYRMWSVPRILAILFVPNPNGYKFVKAPDPYNPKTMEWCRTPARTEDRNDYTSKESRNEVLEGLDTKSKEYFRAYNRIKGQDGLTNTQRYVARKRALGLVKIMKNKSPTGHEIWVSVPLKVLIMTSIENGTIGNEEVRLKLIDMIREEEERIGSRINKPYKN